MTYTAILFDLDGTLLNTNELILRTFNYTLKKVLGHTYPPEEIMATYGRPLSEVMYDFDAQKAPLLLDTYRAYNAEIHDQYVTLFPDVRETLTQLKAMGLKLAIVTSKKNDIAYHGLAFFHLEDYFDVFIGPEDTQLHKPDAQPALKALERLGCEAKDCIMVGDSPYDILCGNASGCQTAAVRYSVHRLEHLLATNPTFMLDTIADLLPIVSA